jgi:hypothetical protein
MKLKASLGRMADEANIHVVGLRDAVAEKYQCRSAALRPSRALASRETETKHERTE